MILPGTTLSFRAILPIPHLCHLYIAMQQWQLSQHETDIAVEASRRASCVFEQLSLNTLYPSLHYHGVELIQFVFLSNIPSRNFQDQKLLD